MPRLANLLAATEAADAALARARGLAGLSLKECLQARPTRAIWNASFKGEAAIVKHNFGPEGPADARAQIDELTAQAGVMGSGRFRIPQLLGSDAAEGLVVMSRAEGERLDRAIRAAPDRRAPLLTRAGGWLAQYCAPRRETAPFGGGFWVKRRRASINEISAEDAPLVGALVARMEAERALIGTYPMQRARAHGDFEPVNFLVDGDTLWGVDIGNAHPLAIAKDIARFLVCLEMTDPAQDASGRWGVATSDLDALLAGGDLISGEETELILPFFIASEVAGRLKSEVAHPQVMGNLRALAHRLLD